MKLTGGTMNSKRLYSLDVFRGVTIAGMILVNNPGSWAHLYPPLAHAEWHGATPTDWIFPFFLFIVGVAIPIALGKRIERGDGRVEIFSKVFSRALIIFGLGLLLAAFPDFGMDREVGRIRLVHYLLLGIFILCILARAIIIPNREGFWGSKKLRRNFGALAIIVGLIMIILGVQIYDLSHLRIPGVLQRIAVVYAITSLLFLFYSWEKLLWTGLAFLFSYWALLSWVPVPGGIAPNLEPETNLGAWLDRVIFGNHLWSQSKTWDPEGLLSTLPALVTGISGILTGMWLKANHESYKKLSGLLAFGVILLALGCIWDVFFPINKKIWTSSYVLYTSGIALLFFGVIYWLTDILGYYKWFKPFEWYGKNALFVFILSGVCAKLLYKIKWSEGGETISLGRWIYQSVFTPFLSDINASLAYAIMNVLFFLLVAYCLYRWKIFIKV